MISGVLKYGTEQIEYSVADNARLVSRVRIHVNPDGGVEVERPLGVDPDEVRRAVQKRSRWIFRNLKLAAAATKHALPRRYVSGEAHFYLGRRYKLIIIEGAEASDIRLRRGRLEVCLPIADPAAVRRRLREWYRRRAAAYFSKKLNEVVARFDGIASAPPFQLLTMEKRWGSCSPGGQLVLNPSLIKAPAQCVEYVLMHELCHLLEHNHSKRFYALLDKHRPDWRLHKKELDLLAEQLLVD